MILNLDVFIGIFTLLIITWFVFKSIYASELFTGIKTSLRPIRSTLKKNKGSELSHGDSQGNIEQIKIHMDKEWPYRDYRLSLEKLAHQLVVPEKELSIAINHHMGKHFFDFVNTFRIEEVKYMLADSKFKNSTILEILYRVEFNSKSSFTML